VRIEPRSQRTREITRPGQDGLKEGGEIRISARIKTERLKRGLQKRSFWEGKNLKIFPKKTCKKRLCIRCRSNENAIGKEARGEGKKKKRLGANICPREGHKFARRSKIRVLLVFRREREWGEGEEIMRQICRLLGGKEGS